MDVDLTELLTPVEELTIHNAMYTPFYGSVSLADSYFQYKLYKDAWDDADEFQKQAALVEASRAIDNLNFFDDKLDADQRLEFPRTGQTIVPSRIEHACYEIALKLLDGIDPETERDNLTTTNRGLGSVRVNYDRGFVPLHIVHNIASSTAWNLLLPYLNDANDLQLRRG